MEHGWLSAEQVAERLGLHVRTVRGYIRDGRLRATRIGKQYRVARADLEAFAGTASPAGEGVRRVEVSAVVEIDYIRAGAADRLSTLLVAGAQLHRDGDQPLRVQTVYDDARGRLKVIVLGGAATTADVLHTIHEVLGSENDMFGGAR